MSKDLIITRMSNSSWFKLNILGLVIHLDPGYGGFYENQGFKESDMGKADFIFISHEHKDHIRLEAIEKLFGKHTTLVVSKSCEKELMFHHNVILPGQKIVFEKFSVEAIYAYNTEQGHSTKKYHPKDTYLGFVLTFDHFRIYFAGDTDITDEMKQLEKIDLAFLPIGGTYVMDLDEAVEATTIIKPKYVVPMHQANESLENFSHKVSNYQAIILYPGESFKLNI
ncbi:MAG: MBL fold metallo-hydrolase [Bacillota bacterium]|nr:MAG: MBL fold metallo-hydrolase [Bacillota bacterium]